MLNEATIKQMVQDTLSAEMGLNPLFRRFPEAIESDIRCAAEGHPGYGPYGCTRCFAPEARIYEPSEPVVALDIAPRSEHRPDSDPADCELPFDGGRCSCWS